MKLLRIVACTICIAGFAWLILDSLRFRKSLRYSLLPGYSTLNRISPDSATANDYGKVLNSYYEDVYNALPHTLVPGFMLLAGATILCFNKRPPKPSS